MRQTQTAPETVRCPHRGAVPLACCTDCPLLVKVRRRFMSTQVVCYPAENRSPKLARMGFR